MRPPQQLAPGPIVEKVRGLRWAARNLAMDLRYGGSLAGTEPASSAGTAAVTNSQYSVLPHIFAGRIGSSDVLVDVGCGKGRVINWWLSRGLHNRIVGIEHNPEVAKATAARLRRHPNVTVVNEDATRWMPADATLGYMYSPFDAAVMGRFKEHVARRFAGRGFRLLYWNPQFVAVFVGDPRFETQVVELPPGTDSRLQGTHRRYASIALLA